MKFNFFAKRSETKEKEANGGAPYQGVFVYIGKFAGEGGVGGISPDVIWGRGIWKGGRKKVGNLTE
jgi:hypothetical protein